MTEPFLPVQRMRDRAALARDESDTAYFFDLLYLGELVTKVLVIELLAAIQEDRERHRYGLEYRLVRADGNGEWAEVLDELVTGPASQHLLPPGRDSQRAVATGFGASDDAWQRRATDQILQACRCLERTYGESGKNKSSLRQWVRDFVWLRNRTRGHGSPKSATLSTVCPVLESSINEILDGAPAFRRSWAYLWRNLSGKYRVSSFGGGRDEFTFLTRETDHVLANGCYIFLEAPCAVPLLVSDPDLTDFFLPNGKFRSGSYETLSYITDARRTTDASAYALPAAAQPASETAGLPALEIVGNVFSNLPPRRPGYISRTALEAELRRLLRDERHPVITLQGRGGVGKTSLALEVLHNTAQDDDFSMIVWFSARDIDLLPQGPSVVRADVLSVEDVARDFADLMKPGACPKLSDAEAYFTDCLSGKANDGPFLFVFDNFETIREQEQLYEYVNNAIRLPNKVLITTRTRDFKADRPIEVKGMSREEFGALVDEVARRLGIRPLVASDYEEQLFEESDGHPYITKVLLGEVAADRKTASLKRVIATKDALLDALFDRSFARLSAAAQRVFLTLCSWRSLVPRIGLEAVLLRPGNDRLDVERGVIELEQCSLIEETRDRESGASFLSVPLAAALFGKKKLVTSPLTIAIESDMELVRAFGTTTSAEVPQGLGPRINKLARWAARRAEAGDEPTQELAVLEYIATEHAPAWLDLSRLQDELGKPNAAISSTNRYLEARPDDREGWDNLIRLYRASGNALGEMHARLQLAELTTLPFEDLSSSASRLNSLLSRRELELDADERRLMVRKLRTIMEARAGEADATDLSRLAWLCMHDQDTAAAGDWVAKGLAIDPNNQHCQALQSRLSGSAGR